MQGILYAIQILGTLGMDIFRLVAWRADSIYARVATSFAPLHPTGKMSLAVCKSIWTGFTLGLCSAH